MQKEISEIFIQHLDMLSVEAYRCIWSRVRQDSEAGRMPPDSKIKRTRSHHNAMQKIHKGLIDMSDSFTYHRDKTPQGVLRSGYHVVATVQVGPTSHQHAISIVQGPFITAETHLGRVGEFKEADQQKQQ
jgi:hypothetical protein